MEIDVKKILKERGALGKYQGVVPEGFVLILEKSLEELKDFETWKAWKNERLTLKELNDRNYE